MTLVSREGATTRGRHVLPTPRTPLIGRDDQVQGVLAALANARLLTLTGPGGTGKTRLALAVAAAVDGLATDGVAWVELAGIGSPDLVPEAVAAALRVQEVSDRSALQAVADHIETGAVLLALDNCEHLTGACADLVDELLDSCPNLRVLATSREPLAVDGESLWPVPPLSLPRRTFANWDAVASCASAQLFEQRARAVLPEFRLTSDNAETVARVCRDVDGLPLAIELAAARVRVLSVEQIGAGLSDVFRLLAGGARTAPQRQQTLRATLDWSHDLLSEPERVVFRRLSVFPGGFSMAAAEHVATLPDPDANVVDLLTRLVDRSLVNVQRSGERARYRLLAPIRTYARERLVAADEDAAVGRAHLEFFARLVESTEPQLTGPDQAAGLDRLEAEANNLRAALAFARDREEPVRGMRLAAGLWRMCALRGHYREGREWLDWAASVGAEGPIPLHAKALRGGGTLAFLHCDYPGAVQRLEQALRLYRELDDSSGIAGTLQVLGSVAREQGDYQRAESLYEESRVLFEAVGDGLGTAQAHGFLGFAAWLQGNWAPAIDQCERALTEFRVLGDGDGIAWSLLSLGIVAQYQGDYERADQLLTQAQDLSRRVGYPEGVAWSLHELGLLAVRRGDSNAERLLLDSLARHRDLNDEWRTASVLSDLASCILAGGEPERAAALLGAAAAIRTRIGSVVAPCERADYDRVDQQVRAALGGAGFDEHWSRGRDIGILDDLLGASSMPPAAAEVTAADARQAVDSGDAGSTADTVRAGRTSDAGDAGAAEVTPPAVPAPRATRVSEAPVPVEAVPLRIHVLGQASVLRDGRALSPADWGYGKPRELFFLLAASPPQTKEQLGLALWPGLSGAQLRNALHTALRDLRKAVRDPNWVRFSAGKYALDRSREHWLDLGIFERELTAARRARPNSAALPHLQRAISVYGGDLLPEFADSEWTQDRRDELRRSYGAALAGAGRILATEGHFRQAADAFRKAVAHEPLDEAAHRQLMKCLVRAGEPGLAARQYEQLTVRLRDELGVAPAAETTSLYEQLRRAK
jgi:predicted ATPase/DNA-binding SARP family transcriptional activator